MLLKPKLCCLLISSRVKFFKVFSTLGTINWMKSSLVFTGNGFGLRDLIRVVKALMTLWKWKKIIHKLNGIGLERTSELFIFFRLCPVMTLTLMIHWKLDFRCTSRIGKNLLITLWILRPPDGLWLWQLWQISFHWILRNWIVRGINIFYGTLCTSFYSNSVLGEYQSNGKVITVPLLISSPCTI